MCLACSKEYELTHYYRFYKTTPTSTNKDYIMNNIIDRQIRVLLELN